MSNDPPASDNPTLEPGALINSDGNYCLQHADVIALLKYVWTGVLLPTDMAEFKERVHLKGDFEQELVPGITQLLEHYKVIQAHNKTFKDTTYPGITALAGQVKDYADTVGGNPDTSYYALLLQSCLDLDTELKKPNPDQQRVADLKDTIKGIVDDQLASIETLQTAASVATQSLRDYEEQTKKDQQDLKTTKDELDLILKGPGGEITTLDSDLAAKRQELSDDQAEYEHDVIVACTALTYVWIFPVGTIAGAVVMGVYGDKARKMKATIEAIEQLIGDDDAKLATDKHLVADLALIENDMDSVISQIGPAITVIEKMMGAWDAITGDLKAIQDFVNNKETKGTPALLKINQKIVIKKWNDLSDAVKKYQLIAYVSVVDEQDIGDWVNQLK